MASPICTVNATATTNGVNVTASSLVTIALASTAGVRTWSLSCVGTDDTLAAATINAGLSINQVTKTATYTHPGVGTALLFLSRVNDGLDGNGQPDATLTTTFKVCALTAGGDRVLALNETSENNANFGWLPVVNDMIRSGGGGGGASLPIVLTTDVSGILPRANGGTGLSAAGSDGNVLRSDGTNWAAAAINLAGGVNAVTGQLPIANLAAPDFGAQNITTTGALKVGSGSAQAADAGIIRTPHQSTGSIDFWAVRNQLDNGNRRILGLGSNINALVVGDANWTDLQLTAGTGGSARFIAGNMQMGLQSTGAYINTSANTFQIFNNAANFQSGSRVVFLNDRTTAPTGNPSGGGFLYSESGALRWRSSGGVITEPAATSATSATTRIEARLCETAAFSGSTPVTVWTSPAIPSGGVLRATIETVAKYTSDSGISGFASKVVVAKNIAGTVTIDAEDDLYAPGGGNTPALTCDVSGTSIRLRFAEDNAGPSAGSVTAFGNYAIFTP